jgi:hypothetical protein
MLILYKCNGAIAHYSLRKPKPVPNAQYMRVLTTTSSYNGSQLAIAEILVNQFLFV